MKKMGFCIGRVGHGIVQIIAAIVVGVVALL